MASKPKSARKCDRLSDEALLDLARADFKAAVEFWRDPHDERATDVRYAAGNPWDPQEKRARDDAKRPCLAPDELGQYYNQLINDARANPVGVKYEPAGDGADEKTSEFYEGKAREIEYRSKAQQAYIAALENAVMGGYGFVRVMTKRAGPKSRDLELEIRPVPNPDQVLIDPLSTRPDASDAKHAFVFEAWRPEDFKKRWPNARAVTFAKDDLAIAPEWFKGTDIIVAEYWRLEEERHQAVLVQPAVPSQDIQEPFVVYRDEVDEGYFDFVEVLDEWEDTVPYVCSYLVTGVDVLERNDWPGSHIPIAACYGKQLYLTDGGTVKRVLMSMTRLARDPVMMHAYYTTTEAEVVGMTPKFPYFYYENQLNPEMKEAIALSNRVPVAAIEVKPLLDVTGGTVLPFPQRAPYDPPIAALLAGKESAKRSIQAAMGFSPLPTSAQRQNQKSGVALAQIEQSGQRGSFHFLDNYRGMIEYVGVILEDLIDKVYDTPRDTPIRMPDETSKVVRVNDPAAPESYPTKGRHLVTVSTGPSHDSQHEEASDFADLLMQTSFAPKIADIAIRMKGLGTKGDELADRLMPPEARQQQGQDGKPPDPKQLQQMLGQMTEQFQQLQQAAEAMKRDLDTDAAKQQATIQKAQLDAQTALQKTQIEAQAAVEKARMEAELAITLQTMKDENAIRVAEIAAASRLEVASQQADTKLTEIAAKADSEDQDRALDVVKMATAPAPMAEDDEM
jgi:hypothetical protein